MRLSELLDEVRADAPPARYDVEDAVRAGKRLRRRRRTGWAIAAGTAVAVVIAVPYLAAQRPAPRLQQAAPTPSISASAGSTPVPGIDYVLSPYTTGGLAVGKPTRWTLAEESAPIEKKGGEPDTLEGVITVYHRGVDPRGTLAGAKITPTTAIRGRPAYRVDADGSPMLLWEYADDAMALVTSRANGPGRFALTVADLRRVAEAFRPGRPQPVRIPFGASYVPEGYSLVEVTPTSAQFVPTPAAVARLGKPDPGPAAPPIAAISLRFAEPSVRHGTPRDGVICPEVANGKDAGRKAYCFAFLGDAYVEEAVSRSAVDTVELGRMLKSGRFVPLSDPDHWIPVNEAFPASALVGGE